MKLYNSRIHITRRAGLAPLEMIIALPLLMVMFLGIMYAFWACDHKAGINIQSRHEAWMSRHEVANEEFYAPPKRTDPAFGAQVAQLDNQVRWIQYAKIHFLGENASTPESKNYQDGDEEKTLLVSEANKGVITHTAKRFMIISPIWSNKGQVPVETTHYVLGGTWDHRHLKFDDRVASMIPRLRTGVFMMPSFDAQGYLKYGDLLGRATTIQNRLPTNQLPSGVGSGAGVTPPDVPGRDQLMQQAGVPQAMAKLDEKLRKIDEGPSFIPPRLGSVEWWANKASGGLIKSALQGGKSDANGALDKFSQAYPSTGVSPATLNQIKNGNNQDLPPEIRNQVANQQSQAQTQADIENATNKSKTEAEKLQANQDKIIADAKEKYGDKSGNNPDIEKQVAEEMKKQEEELKRMEEEKKKMEEEMKKKMMEEMMKNM